MNLWIIFLTGLTTGGLSCAAMQGGLLSSIIANQKEKELANKHPYPSYSSFSQVDWMPVILFLTTKLISHTILGFLLGALGSQIELNLTARLVFQGLAALFMLATAANLINLHPIFRYLVLQPPKFARKIIKNSIRSQAYFTPTILGFMTLLIPCGVTQAMALLAITSGKAITGALIMFFFVLGTSPLFALLGLATAKLSDTFQRKFLLLAAATLIILAIHNLNGILVVLDSPITLAKLTNKISTLSSSPPAVPQNQSPIANGIQQVIINIKSNGYSPNRVTVKSEIPVRLTLQTQGVYSCASSFIFKAYNIHLQLGPNDTKTVTFTPTAKGIYTFTCSMGMYTGFLEVT